MLFFFKESLNTIGSLQIFYPLLNYLSSNQDYVDLVTNEWSANAKAAYLNDNSNDKSKFKYLPRKSSFDGIDQLFYSSNLNQILTF